MTHVEDVSVTLTLSSGEQHTLTVHRPGPLGDNPRFIAQQIATGMADLAARADRVADLYNEYGSQIRPDGGVEALAVRLAAEMGHNFSADLTEAERDHYRREARRKVTR